MNLNSARKIVYNMLGRIAHLLQDMSVPAHTHLHEHPCPANRPDYFENAMGSVWPKKSVIGGRDCEKDPGGVYNAEVYNYQSALTQSGPLITDILYKNNHEAMFQLFYTLNQLGDFFPSGVNNNDTNGGAQYKRSGNSNLPNTTCQDCNQYLQNEYNLINNGSSPTDIHVGPIAVTCLNYAIRATASLFYWFAVKTNQILPPYIHHNNFTYPIVNTTYKATSIVAQNSVINPGKNIIYKASNNIRLLPGFKASAGSNFMAQIVPCSDLIKKTNTTTDIVTETEPDFMEQNNEHVIIKRQNSILGFPNPFKEDVILKYYINKSEFISIELFNMYGQKIHTIINNQFKEQGEHELFILNNLFSNGLYYCKLLVGKEQVITKLIKIE